MFFISFLQLPLLFKLLHSQFLRNFVLIPYNLKNINNFTNIYLHLLLHLSQIGNYLQCLNNVSYYNINLTIIIQNMVTFFSLKLTNGDIIFLVWNEKLVNLYNENICKSILILLIQFQLLIYFTFFQYWSFLKSTFFINSLYLKIQLKSIHIHLFITHYY